VCQERVTAATIKHPDASQVCFQEKLTVVQELRTAKRENVPIAFVTVSPMTELTIAYSSGSNGSNCCRAACVS
jgi:hypothetical protein